MPAVRANIRLKSIDVYIRQKHGTARSLLPAELDIVDRYAAQMIRQIRSQWPMDTGTSWGAWQWEVQGQPGAASLVIENPMDYTTFVHPAGTAPNPSAAGALASSYAGRLITQAFNATKNQMVAAIKRQIDREEGRRQTRRAEPTERTWDLAERLRLIAEARARA